MSFTVFRRIDLSDGFGNSPVDTSTKSFMAYQVVHLSQLNCQSVLMVDPAINGTIFFFFVICLKPFVAVRVCTLPGKQIFITSPFAVQALPQALLGTISFAGICGFKFNAAVRVCAYPDCKNPCSLYGFLSFPDMLFVSATKRAIKLFPVASGKFNSAFWICADWH